MKNLAIWTVVGVVLVAANGSVFAATLVPTGQNFKAKGGISLFGPDLGSDCNVNFKGKVDNKGTGEITYATFETTQACTKIRSAGLPWKFKATGEGAGKIMGISITAPGVFCGPSNIPVQISSGGAITINNAAMAGHCTVATIEGPLQTYPPITTAP